MNQPSAEYLGPIGVEIGFDPWDLLGYHVESNYRCCAGYSSRLEFVCRILTASSIA